MARHGFFVMSTRTFADEKLQRRTRARQVRAIILEHLRIPVRLLRRRASGIRIARKHLGWYCEQLSDPDNVRRSLMAAANTAVQFALARRHLDDWVSGCLEAA